MNMNKKVSKHIYASIVICTYNGANNVEKCIQSLLNQDYPKEKYEIILVDDGSSDDTFTIASKFPITVIRHTVNKGLSAARNTGLQHANGAIYVCFDDDCVADQHWLRELLTVYSEQEVAGVCGYTKNSTNDLVDIYLTEIGHGNPSPLLDAKKKNPLQRLITYLKDMYSKTSTIQHKSLFAVNEIWGENCSFPVSLLKAVHGWDEHLSGVEDTDLSKRIKQVTNKPFLCTRKAVIYHDGKITFMSLLKKPYKRGYAILRFYLQNHKIPPLFPFPIILVLLSASSVYLFGFLGLFMVIFAPQLLYSWWIVKYFKSRKLHYLLFPYMQCSLELSGLFGLLSGYCRIFLNKINLI